MNTQNSITMFIHSLLLLVFALCSSEVSSYNYLVVNPIYGYSHAKFLGKLSDVIAEGGHKVVSCEVQSIKSTVFYL